MPGEVREGFQEEGTSEFSLVEWTEFARRKNRHSRHLTEKTDIQLKTP